MDSRNAGLCRNRRANDRTGRRPSLALRTVFACAALMLLVLADSRLLLALDATGAAQSSPALAPIPASRAATNLAIITIKGEITPITVHSVERRIKQAIDGGADGLVFEIDSPGGEVNAVIQVCSAIKRAPVHTIAWINPTAYSGGAIVALACKQIVVAPNATMGDAGVIGFDPIGLSFLQGLKPTERAKGLSLIIPELVDSARRNGYDENLVQAFASLGVELWLIRDKESGREWFVNESEYRQIWNESPPRGSPAIASGGLKTLNEDSKRQGQWQDYSTIPADPGVKDVDVEPGHEYRPAAPELDNQEIRNAVHNMVDRGSQRPIFTGKDSGRYELVEYTTDGNVLLTLKEADLKRYGFADPAVTISTDEEMQKYVGATNVTRLDQSWSESLVTFMTWGTSGLVIKGLLIVIFLMAMFIEMSMPGVGLPGLIALVALAGLVVPPMLIGAANWWMGAMAVGGLLLVLLEIFVLPGFGVPGIIGVVMLFVGMVGVLAAPGQLFPGTGPGGWGELARAGSIVVLALFLAGVGIYFFIKYTDRFPVLGRLVLAGQPMADEQGGGMLAAMAPEPGSALLVRVGQIGRTVTPLRPSGTAEFGDRLVDVVSEFGFVEAEKLVRVVSVTEYRVGVEPAQDVPKAASSRGSAPNPPQET